MATLSSSRVLTMSRPAASDPTTYQRYLLKDRAIVNPMSLQHAFPSSSSPVSAFQTPFVFQRNAFLWSSKEPQPWYQQLEVAVTEVSPYLVEMAQIRSFTKSSRTADLFVTGRSDCALGANERCPRWKLVLDADQRPGIVSQHACSLREATLRWIWSWDGLSISDD